MAESGLKSCLELSQQADPITQVSFGVDELECSDRLVWWKRNARDDIPVVNQTELDQPEVSYKRRITYARGSVGVHALSLTEPSSCQRCESRAQTVPGNKEP